MIEYGLDFQGYQLSIGTAFEKLREPGIGFHEGENDVGGSRAFECELLGDLIERGKVAGSLLELNEKHRNPEKCVVQAADGFALLRARENLVHEVGNFDGAAHFHAFCEVCYNPRLRRRIVRLIGCRGTAGPEPGGDDGHGGGETHLVPPRESWHESVLWWTI